MRYEPLVRSSITLALYGIAVSACSRSSSAPSEPPPPPPVEDTLAQLAVVPDAAPETPRCASAPGAFLFVSPAMPAAGKPMHVIAVSDQPLEAELAVALDRDGGLRASSHESPPRQGGPPYFWHTTLTPKVGDYQATLSQPGCAPGEGATELRVRATAHGGWAPRPPKNGVWPTRQLWSRNLENVYSAWIEALFDAPENEQPSWNALHEILRDPQRNFLYDYLGADEDSGKDAPSLRPDCADLPYFLRAYFAWKLRLPFGVAECSRGGGGYAPSCRPEWAHNELLDQRAEDKKEKGIVASFGAYARGKIADVAHSGSARTAYDDPSSDYYPVPIRWDTLRPGTVYADPYGHVLMISKRVAQTHERGGILFAVDGQPDGTVARKRFWRGNFLYAHDPLLGGPGFKRFRPIGRRPGSSSPEFPMGELERLGDAEIQRHADYGDLSLEAGALDVEAFYDAMDDALSPRPRDANAALLEAIVALDEQVRTRVQSVDNGRKWLDKGEAPATMPDGPEIFETSGAWEDFATPSRDLRLLIAIDVVRGFPAKVARRPERFAAVRTDAGVHALQAELEATLERELAARKVSYTRSDGSSFELTLQEVLARAPALETAYNLNDCVEARWGAPAGSPEILTCKRRAPADQVAKMEQNRSWFSERKRPPRK